MSMRDRAVILAFGCLAALPLLHCGGSSSQPILPMVQQQANGNDTNNRHGSGDASSVSSAGPQQRDGGITNDGGSTIQTGGAGANSVDQQGAGPQDPADPGQPAAQQPA